MYEVTFDHKPRLLAEGEDMERVRQRYLGHYHDCKSRVVMVKGYLYGPDGKEIV